MADDIGFNTHNAKQLSTDCMRLLPALRSLKMYAYCIADSSGLVDAGGSSHYIEEKLHKRNNLCLLFRLTMQRS